MRYLSFDLEATGLEEHALIIEFAAIPFDTATGVIDESLAFHTMVHCPSFEELRPSLNPWVIEHNQTLIEKAHREGRPLPAFKAALDIYFNRDDIRRFFGSDKIVLFGKSMSGIDLPFLNRDLGKPWMESHFSHRTLDLTCFVMGLIDMGFLPPACQSGSELMKFLGKGEVCHTALEDARHTAQMHLELIRRFSGLQAEPHA